jgi:hypothetical protein
VASTKRAMAMAVEDCSFLLSTLMNMVEDVRKGIGMLFKHKGSMAV